VEAGVVLLEIDPELLVVHEGLVRPWDFLVCGGKYVYQI
jgi:hypothetical protein